MGDWLELPLEELGYWVSEAIAFQESLNKEQERQQKDAERKAKKK